jgi:hypothetical protein
VTALALLVLAAALYVWGSLYGVLGVVGGLALVVGVVETVRK